MKNGGKNKSVALIILFSVQSFLYFTFFFYFFCLFIFIYVYFLFSSFLLYVCRCLCELEAYDTKTNSLYAQAYLAIKSLSDSEILNLN